MATLDIRNQKKENITEIMFDESEDRIFPCDNGLSIRGLGIEKILCDYDDLDNFIAACKKAKELWGK